ncbi:PREDICTED: protein PFC0760c [Polistes dominula]|uniref:Protein PFC0760c n=1 Tax=Polistes dominula TaxID=743375 RepID=A0ABM1HX39_POLDO|nr:PREDICTED: protein PFC0760c [Polistes dominula]
MSFLLATSQSASYLANKEKEDLLYSDEGEENYNFKYISGNQFKYIIKDVQRRRCRDEEEREWYKFVKQQELDVNLSTKRYNREDRELRRLEEDALPEYKLGSYVEDSERNDHKSIYSEEEEEEDDIPNKIIKTKSNDTIIIDMDQSILKEDSLPYRRRTVKSKRSSDLKKTLSDIVQSKQPKESHVACNFEHNSNLELSIEDESDKEDNISLQADPITVHRIIIMQQRISELLDEILFRLDKIPLPDGELDLKRRQQRVMEFCIRLSRNYLYDLTRYVNDIQKHVHAVSPSVKIKSSHRSITLHMQIIEQKLIAAHQLLLHALTAYCRHIPSSIPHGHSKKIKELLKIVIDLKDICDHIELTKNYFASGDTCTLPREKEMETKCNAILSKLRLSSGTESQLDDHNTVSNLVIPINVSRRKNHSKHKNLETRLKMYNNNTNNNNNNNNNKNSSVYHIKDKKPSASRNKIIYNEHLSLPQQPNSSPITNASSKGIIEDDKMYNTSLKEDDIKTIMSTVPIDSDNDINLEIQSKRSTKLSKKTKVTKDLPNKLHNVKYSKDELKHNKRRSSHSHLCNDPMNKKYGSATSDEVLYEFLQKSQHFQDFNDKDVSTSDFTSRTLKKCHTSKNKEEIKQGNMQLIYLSSLDNVSNEQTCCNSTNYLDNLQSQNGAIQLIISKETEVKFLKYRAEYYNLFQSSPMYSNNTQNKPWDIVAWISDKLVDELINEIAKELEMQDIIQKMYQLEFKEF